MQATWVLNDGSERSLEVPPGQSLMQAATAAGIAGIIGECGGNMACATCHVFVAPEWADCAGPPGDMEDAMLDATASERGPTSRLSCQIAMTAALDGIRVTVPPEN